MSIKGTTSSAQTLQLDFTKLCKTTGWHNNCGLNALTHFLVAKLSAFSNSELDIFLSENPEYLSLLASFNEYYGLTQEHGWHDVLDLLRAHPVPTDQEAIFAPVLRKHLGKALMEHQEALWDTDASMAVSDYIKHGTVADVAQPVYRSNKEYLDGLKKRFEEALIEALNTPPTERELATARSALANHSDNKANPQYKMTEEEILRHVIFQRRNTIEDEFVPIAQIEWLTNGCQRYANYIADMNNSVMVSADHLQFLCEKLNIGAEVYTLESMRHALLHNGLAEYTGGAQSMPQREFPWVIKVFNMGLHWIYQEPNNDVEKAREHNQYYPNEMMEAFFTDEKQSGKFKLYGGRSISKELIIAEVKCQFGEISSTELEAIKEAHRLAVELSRLELKMAQAKKLQPSTSTLSPSVHRVFNQSDEGKKYIQLFEQNAAAVKVVNEKFSGVIAKAFIAKYADAKTCEKIAKLNALSLVSFLEKFAALNKPVLTDINRGTMQMPTVISTPVVVPTPVIGPSRHLLQEAISVNSARSMTPLVSERKGIKLPFLAIMQTNAAATAIAKLIEANPQALTVFNQYDEAYVRSFVNNPKLPALLLGFAKLLPEQQVSLLQKYPATLQPKVDITQNVTLK
ncbi:hypothetical protein [Candidatus Berkiella aquae]|uniref:Uncharacterized protein n=1 Tax=Candidatus Berkiella aquae TaxID=295108 RepID=A0A0Q9YUH1_9GAMM|nr:hypothetical protein [Candidatus Berkiella aquae]MCS5710930.1 hypothetical protein [Candidatus Berkiella aquae]